MSEQYAIQKPRTLTVIIRDDAPLVHCNDAPIYRTVQMQLTPEQVEAMRLRGTYESISKCWIEPEIET
jgi:hypothetical protein